MNTEAYDAFIKLEEEAESILIGHTILRKPGEKYISRRKRLKNSVNLNPETPKKEDRSTEED